MKRFQACVVVVVILLLALGLPAHGGPSNPTESNEDWNTAGGTDALLKSVGKRFPITSYQFPHEPVLGKNLRRQEKEERT
jgi:hypothetical protein